MEPLIILLGSIIFFFAVQFIGGTISLGLDPITGEPEMKILNRITIIDVFEPILAEILAMDNSERIKEIIQDQFSVKVKSKIPEQYIIVCESIETDCRIISITDKLEQQAYDIIIGNGSFHVSRSAVEDHTIDNLQQLNK